MLLYSYWCILNCIVINPVKSNILLFNSANVAVSIIGRMLDNPDFVKYLGIHIDDRLFWNYQVKHVTQKCCQHIDIFKKVLLYLLKYVAIL